jgi:zinc transporter ZupT
MSEDFIKKQETIVQKIENAKKELSAISSSTPSSGQTTWWSTTNAATMSSIVLVFGLLICVLVMMLMRQGRNADSVLKVMGTILIIISSIFLVVAGYTDTQIAPVMGLLGTIAGYLLGKNSDALPRQVDNEVDPPRQPAD